MSPSILRIRCPTEYFYLTRYERLTGHSVVHAASGTTLAEIRPSRRSTDTSRQNATDS